MDEKEASASLRNKTVIRTGFLLAELERFDLTDREFRLTHGLSH